LLILLKFEARFVGTTGDIVVAVVSIVKAEVDEEGERDAVPECGVVRPIFTKSAGMPDGLASTRPAVT
jgi:hypothetical protein